MSPFVPSQPDVNFYGTPCFSFAFLVPLPILLTRLLGQVDAHVDDLGVQNQATSVYSQLRDGNNLE